MAVKRRGSTGCATVLYDADCGPCITLMAGLLAWDRAGSLRPLPIQSTGGERLLDDLDEAERLRSWHIVTEAGARHSAGAGLAPLLSLLPGGRPLAALTERFPGAAEAAYRVVADHRPLLGRMVPPSLERRARARVAAPRPASSRSACQ